MRSLSILIFVSMITATVQANDLKLWYPQPADRWEAALPLGNGHTGAMVYGGVESDTIQLNEDTFWAGGPHNNLNPAARENLPKIRDLINQKNYVAASDLAEKTITSQGAQGMPYQSAGVLHLNFSSHKNFDHYYRELDLQNAVARTRYQIGDVVYEREIFSSFVDQVLVIKLHASRKAALDFSLQLSHPEVNQQSLLADKSLLMQTKSIDHEGVKGQVRLAALTKIISTDGKIRSKQNSLQVQGATDAILLVSLATNFVNYADISADEIARAQTKLQQAEQKLTATQDAYQKQLQAHTNFYRQYFDRVSLDLGSNEFAKKPTDERIREFAKVNDPALVGLLFQFGRYLLISSSQPGSQAANLQGIWNDKSLPPWDSKYTLNINAEMNYWPAEVTNLSELHQPFFDLIRDLSVTGQDAAKTMYGARGWMAHHNTDIWRISGAIDWSWGAWPTSNAWLVQHMWQRYLYTGDKEFLRSAYPIMKGACEFFEDFLVKDPERGWLVVSPSMSPENEAPPTGKKIAAGVTMDNQLLFDLFTHTSEAARILDQDSDKIAQWKKILNQLPPMQIGQYHQLQEWIDDWDSPEDHHRHVSHLYGLYPSNQISPLRSPELFNAAKVSLEQRGDPSTGWSMNWKINLWARLLDGNRALKLIREQIQLVEANSGEGGGAVQEAGGTYANLFDAHPPFQIDGNFGFTSGVAEMLAQSHDGAIHLLPALPNAWPSGQVKGLVMRGGFVVDIKWQKGKVIYLKVLSKLGGNLRLRSYAPLPDAIGFKTKSARGNNPNPFYSTPTIKPYLKHTDLVMPALSLDKIYLIDVKTNAGSVYEWGESK